MFNIASQNARSAKQRGRGRGGTQTGLSTRCQTVRAPLALVATPLHLFPRFLCLDHEVLLRQLEPVPQAAQLEPRLGRAEARGPRAEQLLGARGVGQLVRAAKLVVAHVLAERVGVQPVQRHAGGHALGRGLVEAVQLRATDHLGRHLLQLLRQHPLLEPRAPQAERLQRAKRRRHVAELADHRVERGLQVAAEVGQLAGGQVLRPALEVVEPHDARHLQRVRVERAQVGEQCGQEDCPPLGADGRTLVRGRRLVVQLERRLDRLGALGGQRAVRAGHLTGECL
mmetsp:Transcript_3800/g.9607  ORF Transcript_3800/g.9607 Transcript_3800/m.9607 type:complete len:284 (+) Transcript_3800:270-1121(+)